MEPTKGGYFVRGTSADWSTVQTTPPKPVQDTDGKVKEVSKDLKGKDD